MFIKKVVVNLGGKYCFVFFLEGEVYFWGEVEDGKLGYGNRRYCVKILVLMIFLVCCNVEILYWFL